MALTKKDINQIIEVVEVAVDMYWHSDATINDMYAKIRSDLEEMRTQKKIIHVKYDPKPKEKSVGGRIKGNGFGVGSL